MYKTVRDSEIAKKDTQVSASCVNDRPSDRGETVQSSLENGKEPKIPSKY